MAADLPDATGEADSAAVERGPLPRVETASGFVIVTGTHEGDVNVTRGKLVIAERHPSNR